MPIDNTRDILPFVNGLERLLFEMQEEVNLWTNDRQRLSNAATAAFRADSASVAAMVRADESLAEIGTATFKSTAARGRRLEDTLNKLRSEIFELIESGAVGGGGGELTSGTFYEELNHAVSTVDPTIEDGLKLDYRLREIQEMAETGGKTMDKEIVLPLSYKPEGVISETSVTVPRQVGVLVLEGVVTVLDKEGLPILSESGEFISGTISSDGVIQLTHTPNQEASFYYPVEMQFKDIPKDFLRFMMEQMIEKNSIVMKRIIEAEKLLNFVLSEIDAMKGTFWTPDITLMRNHQDIIREAITPKGLVLEHKGDFVHASFSYSQHEELSHFEAEQWDEESKSWKPFDGDKGLINN